MGKRLLALRNRPLDLWGLINAAGAVLSAATLLGFMGGWWWAFDLFAHFRVQYLWALTLAALMLVYPRRFMWAATFACFACVNLVVIAPLYFEEADATLGSPGPVFRALLFNVNSGLGDPGEIAGLVRNYDPDIIVLEELSARWLDPLRVALAEYPHASIDAREDNFGIGFFSRLPVEKAECIPIGDAGVPSIVATLNPEGTHFTIIATHALPPMGAHYANLRDGQIEALRRHVEQAEYPVLLLGDLNATPWSFPYRRLLKTSGLRDSLRGYGVQTTWPTSNPLLRIPIDHGLFTDGIRIHHRERGHRAGSDHFPVIVDFSVSSPKSSALHDGA